MVAVESAVFVALFAVTGVAVLYWSWKAVVVLGVPAILAFARATPRVRVGALIGGAMLDRFGVHAAGLVLRPVHVVVLIALAAEGLRQIRVSRVALWPSTRATLVTSAMVLGVFIGALHGQSARTLRVGGLVALGLALRWLLDTDLSNESLRRWAAGFIVKCAVAEAALGLLCLASHFVVRTSFGVQQDPSEHFPLVYGTFFEANVYGSFLAAALIIALRDSRNFFRGRVTETLSVATIGLALLASLTRGAWVGFAVGVLTSILVGWRHRRTTRRVLSRLTVVALGGLTATALVPAMRSRVLARLENIWNLRTGSGFGRVRINSLAIQEWKSSPWIGHGWGSFNTHLPGDTSLRTPWIPNLTVGILHDVGLIGLVLITVFFIRLAARLVRASAARSEFAASCLGAIVALLVAFQATPGFILGYFWVFVSFAGAVGVAHRRGGTRELTHISVGVSGDTSV